MRAQPINQFLKPLLNKREGMPRILLWSVLLGILLLAPTNVDAGRKGLSKRLRSYSEALVGPVKEAILEIVSKLENLLDVSDEGGALFQLLQHVENAVGRIIRDGTVRKLKPDNLEEEY